MPAEVGEKAPDFTLSSDSWENKVSRAEKGCFEEQGARILAVSADTPWSHRAFAAERGIEFPLLSDFERETVEDYGVKSAGGNPERAYFIIDREEIIRAREVEATPKDQPGVEEVLRDLKKAL